jgi:hypothetical protein
MTVSIIQNFGSILACWTGSGLFPNIYYNHFKYVVSWIRRRRRIKTNKKKKKKRKEKKSSIKLTIFIPLEIER